MPPLRVAKPIPPKPYWQWYEYATWLAVLLVFVVFVAGGFFLKPRVDEIFMLNAGIERAKEDERIKKQSLERIDLLIANAKALSAQENAWLDYLLPKKPDLPGLFVQSEQLTQSSGMQLRSLEAAEQGEKLAEGPLGVLSLPFSISYETSARNPYQVLKQSLTAFESNLRLFDILSFTFEVKQEDESAQSAGTSSEEEEGKEMEMKIRTYYFPQ